MGYSTCLDRQTGLSVSGSLQQPEATRPLWQFQDYTGADGQPALSVQLDVRDMAKLYRECPKSAGGYERTWNTVQSNPYFEGRVRNADDALRALDAFTFPDDIKLTARRAARELAGVFEQVARLRVVRDLTAGRLDRRKLVKIARHTAAGAYDPNVVRPYRRTLPTPSDTPTIAIVASAGNAEMWADEAYIPRVLTLALSVLWACEAAGLDTYAALTEGHLRPARSQRYREAVFGTMLASPGTTVSPRAYGVALHRDLWRYGFMTAQAADEAGNRRLCELAGGGEGPGSIGLRWPSIDGGAASRWARQVLGADIVVGIGRITDTPDIKLGSSFSIDQAVKEIAAQAQKLERAA